MKLALLGSRGFPSTYGGFETFVRRLAPYLRDRGHEVTVYGRRGPGRTVKESRDGICCVDTPGIETKELTTISHGATASAHATLARHEAVLVVNVAHGYFLPLLKLAGIPTALNVDGLEWMREKWGPIARRSLEVGAELSGRYATALVADSVAVARLWKKRFHRDSYFIPYGADVVHSASDEKLTDLGIAPGEYVLVVARLAPENNVGLVLDAVSTMSPRPRTVVVGSANYQSPLADRLQRMAARSEVVWLGHVWDQGLLTQLWAHAGVYVHGHSAGGTNPALLQALGCGAPTVALDTEFNREVLTPYDKALFQRDTLCLVEHIASTLSGDTSRCVTRAQGAAMVKERYPWDAVCRAYHDLLTATAAHRHPSNPLYRPPSCLKARST